MSVQREKEGDAIGSYGNEAGLLILICSVLGSNAAQVLGYNSNLGISDPNYKMLQTESADEIWSGGERKE